MGSPPGVGGVVSSFAVYDDGTGPALYVGGAISSAAGITVNGIAKWDGTTWSALSGPAGTGVGGSFPGVGALAVWDDGSGPALFAGGRFTTAGGIAANNVAKWNGNAWSAMTGPIENGTSGQVRALAVYDGAGGLALYAGGNFATAGGVVVNDIARWNGDGWSALSGPSGIGIHHAYWRGDAMVLALTVHDDGDGPSLYAGGDFAAAGGVSSRYLAEWSCPAEVFADGFESGDLSAWSGAVGGPLVRAASGIE